MNLVNHFFFIVMEGDVKYLLCKNLLGDSMCKLICSHLLPLVFCGSKAVVG